MDSRGCGFKIRGSRLGHSGHPRTKQFVAQRQNAPGTWSKNGMPTLKCHKMTAHKLIARGNQHHFIARL